MEKNNIYKDTKHMYELLVGKKVTFTLRNDKESKVTGVLLHQTQFELLIKVKVTAKNTGEISEKLRIVPKHSVLIAKEN